MTRLAGSTSITKPYEMEPIITCNIKDCQKVCSEKNLTTFGFGHIKIISGHFPKPEICLFCLGQNQQLICEREYITNDFHALKAQLAQLMSTGQNSTGLQS